MKDILLLFPPGGDITQPYISLPTLTAQIEKHNFAVDQIDLNINFANWVLSKEQMRSCHDRNKRRWDELQNKTRFNIKEEKEYVRLARAVACGEAMAESIDWATNVIRDKSLFFNHDLYIRSQKIIQRCFEIFSVGYFPCEYSHLNYSGKYSPEKSDDILRSIEDKHSDPFFDYYAYQSGLNSICGNYKSVGISIIYTKQIIPALHLSAYIKSEFPDAHIVLGGAAISKFADEVDCLIPLFRYFDGVIYGEGETAIIKFLEYLNKKFQREKIPNYLYLENEKVRKTDVFVIEELNELPPPVYRGVDFPIYFSPETVFLYSPTRGCYWGKCAFCSYGLAHHQLMKYRNKNPILVCEDLKFLQEKYGCKIAFFSMDVASPAYLKKLSEEIIRNNISLDWRADVRFEKNFADPELLKILIKSGCINLSFGMESSCNNVLKSMNKGVISTHFKEIIENCDSEGIAVNILFFVGFPTETKDEAKQTLFFLINNIQFINTTGLATFSLVKGSRVYKNPEQYGIEINHNWNYDMAIEKPYQNHGSGMNMAEVQQMGAYISYQLDKHYPNRNGFFDSNAHLLLYLIEKGVQKTKSISYEQKKTDIDENSIQKKLVLSDKVNIIPSLLDLKISDERIRKSLQLKLDLIQTMTPNFVENEIILKFGDVYPKDSEYILFNEKNLGYQVLNKNLFSLLAIFKKPYTISDILKTIPNTIRTKMKECLLYYLELGILEFIHTE